MNNLASDLPPEECEIDDEAEKTKPMLRIIQGGDRFAEGRVMFGENNSKTYTRKHLLVIHRYLSTVSLLLRKGGGRRRLATTVQRKAPIGRLALVETR